MYPYIHIILPSYGLMAVVGGFAAVVFLYLRLEKFDVLFTEFLRLLPFAALGGLLGSKLLFAVTQIPWLIQNFSLLNLVLLIPRSGYVFYGGLFGVLAAVYLATKSSPELQRRVLQMIAPAIPLFHGFGRIGCFLSGCCYGKALDTPIALWGPITLERIPVQLVEAAVEFILFAVILCVRQAPLNGLKLYFAVYAPFRFAIEFFRGDAVRGVFLGLSTAQWISAAICAYLLLDKRRRRRRVAPQTASPEIEANDQLTINGGVS